MEAEEKVALKLIEALKLAYRLDANILNFILDEVQKAIENLDLPSKKCEICGREMTFFDYHWLDGICEECHIELAKKYEEEW